MTDRGRAAAALILALLAVTLPRRAAAQDTVAVIRHMLALDLGRLRPFQRTYDMLVHAGDSVHAIGERSLTLSASTYAGNPAWLLVESRTGIVPSAESLYVTGDMRPIHWVATLGASRLGVEFAGDSIFGATASPTGRHSLLLVGRPDLLVSLGMVEALLPLLPLDSAWADSAAVLSVDAASGAVMPAELAVVGVEDVESDATSARPSWVIALRAEARSATLWVDRESGEVRRVQQPLPPHVGSMLEYRVKATPATAAPPMPPRP